MRAAATPPGNSTRGTPFVLHEQGIPGGVPIRFAKCQWRALQGTVVAREVGKHQQAVEAKRAAPTARVRG